MTRNRGVGNDLAAGAALLVTVAICAWQLLGLSGASVLQAVALYALLAVMIAGALPASSPGPGIGPANRITLGRAALLLPVTVLALQTGPLDDRVYWWAIGVSTIAMALDGVDGWMARRTATASTFGARFDMELDAFLLMALSVLVWRSGQTGPWVVLVGAMRYLFVAAGWIWPSLRGELPESYRRKVICVVQGTALLICLGPIIPSTVASVTAAGALALLTYSFAVDVRWLLHQRRR